jgi:hypothetical protein
MEKPLRQLTEILQGPHRKVSGDAAADARSLASSSGGAWRAARVFDGSGAAAAREALPMRTARINGKVRSALRIGPPVEMKNTRIY